MEWQSTHALKISPAPSCRFWRNLLTNIAHVTTHGLRYRPAFRMKFAWRIGCGGGGRSPGTSLWKPRSTACSNQWPACSMSGGTTSRVQHLNPEDQSGLMTVPNPSAPLSPRGDPLSQILRNSFSRWPIRRSRQLLRWLFGAEVLLNGACQRTQINQPWGYSGSHQRSEGQQGSWPEQYDEQGFEASHTASGIPPGPDSVLYPPHPSLPYDQVFTIQKPGKDPALKSSYRPSVFWIRLVNYLKRSYWLGSYLKKANADYSGMSSLCLDPG